MKKRYLAAGALALTCASCLALTGCDLFGSNSGNGGGNGGGEWSGITGPTVTQSQWQSVFGNEKYNKNFTTEVAGAVTIQAMSGAGKQTSQVKGLFCADGGKNYSRISGDGYMIEMYELHNASDDYFWVRYEDGAEWEREKVNGLPLSAVVLADYSDCYHCFEYNSKTKSYEATEIGLRQITDIYVSGMMGGSSASAGMTFELTEASFTLENGLPVGAHMRLSIEDNMGEIKTSIDQNIDYTFFDFGTTAVSFPTQIQQWLDQNGIDVEEPPQGEIVAPTPSGKLSEKEWVEIFANESNYENYTNYAYAEGEAKMYSSSGKVLESEMFTMNAFLYADGDKTYATMQDGSDAEVEEIYLYRQGSYYHNWTRSRSGNDWDYDGADVPKDFRMSFINFNALAEAYRYFDYNSEWDRYEINERGLGVLDSSIFAETLFKESVMGEINQWTEFSVRIQNGKIAAVYCTATLSETDGENRMEMSVSLNLDFSDYNKTTVKFPAAIQKQIEELGGSTEPTPTPDPTPSEKLTEKEWIEIFGEKNAANYTGDFTITTEANVSGAHAVMTLIGTAFIEGNKSYTSQTEKKRVSVPGQGNMNEVNNTVSYTYRTNGITYAWMKTDDQPEWSRDELSSAEIEDSMWSSEFATFYRYFSYNSSTRRYEATEDGLKILAELAKESAEGVLADIVINEYSFVVGKDAPISMFMRMTTTQTIGGITTTSVQTAEYHFSNVGKTTVKFPAEIQKEIESLGSSTRPGDSDNPVNPDKPDKPDDNPGNPSVSEGTYGLEYSLTADGKGYAVEGIGTAKDYAIVIPAEYNGLPVKEIRNSAFAYDDSITSVVIPESVSAIGSSAFRGCDALEYVVIAQSVETVGSSAFRDCTSLVAVYYAGTDYDWESVSVGSSNGSLIKAELYFYSASTPVTVGNYWYYDTDGVTPVQW